MKKLSPLVAARVLAVLAVLAVAVAVASPVTAEPLAAPVEVAQWSRFEAGYAPEATPANPFDPDEIDVRAEFKIAGGPVREVPAFWYQGYERTLVSNRERLTPVGEPEFRVRFTPHRAGKWLWRWVVRRNGVVEEHAWTTFRATRAKDPGFVRVSRRDPRYLAFDDGSPYFAVGENTGWYTSRGTFEFDEWFAALEEQGANYGRLWMPSWSFGIEWNDTGLGDYTERLDRAWQLDYVFEQAEERGLYLMLSLLNHGAFSTVFNSAWATNPYNVANGGMLTAPAQFFTNAEARRLFERRLRYVVARWGWSTHLLSWELWNEVNLTLAPIASITSWHLEMVEKLRALDPFDHLVSTSHAFPTSGSYLWGGDLLDFTQIHLYVDGSPQYENVAGSVVGLTQERLGVTGKPVLLAELGVDSRGPSETREADPEGIGIHDGLWAGVVSGGFGTGMTWWWDNLIALEPERYYPMFGAVARFVEGVRWDRERFAPAGATAESAVRPLAAHGLAGRRSLLLWVKDDAYQYHAPDAVEVADARLEMPGRWCGRWYDPWAGAWLGEVTFRDEVAVPPFSRDIALLARRSRCR